VRRAIADAHDEAVLALSELREFIRGLHPAVLNDGAWTRRCPPRGARPLPVRLRVDVPRPASPSVEAWPTSSSPRRSPNVAKHAQATRAEVTVTRDGDVLRVTVTDDGSGGAAPAEGDDAGAGTGLRGLSSARPRGRHADHRQPAGRADNHRRGAAMRNRDRRGLGAPQGRADQDAHRRRLRVVAAVPDAEQLLKAVAGHQPDLAVIDVRMPPTHTDEGIRAALVIRRQYPDVALLSCPSTWRRATPPTCCRGDELVGYLLKDASRTWATSWGGTPGGGGGTALDPESSRSSWSAGATTRMSRLTPRELQVLQPWPKGGPTTGSSKC